MNRKVINAEAVKSSGPYSHATDLGDLIFIAGQTGYNAADYDGKKYSIEEQTNMAFENLEAIMKELNVSYDEVVKANVFLTTMDNFTAMNEIYATKFKAPYPPRTCVAVVGLPLEAEVEIELILKRVK